MTKKLNKWKAKDGNIKLHQVRTPVSFDTTKDQLEDYMEFLGVAPSQWRLFVDSYTSQVVLSFLKDEVSYAIISKQQTNSKGKPSMKDNARVIFHIVQSRVLEMRKGVETIESAFGGFVDWLYTPRLPPRMSRELQERGMREQLPPPKGKAMLEVLP